MRHQRPMAVLTVLALVLALAAAPRARADATHDNLLDRALSLLRIAERDYHGGDRPSAHTSARQALALLTEADRMVRDDAATAFLAVQASVFADDKEQARLWFDRYAARSAYGERDPDLQYARALIALFLEDRPDVAVVALERMLAIAPRARHEQRDVLYYAALIAAGEQATMHEDYLVAMRLFRTAGLLARQRGERNKELLARGNVGIALERAHRYIEAAEVFDQLRQEQPENPIWHWYFGIELGNQTLFDKAIPVYQHVLGMLEEGGPLVERHRALLERAWLRLGNCWRNLAGSERDPARREEQLRLAREAIERFVTLHPDMTAGHYWLGQLLYEELEKPYEAMAQLEEAYRLDPVCDGSLRMMIQIATRYPAPGTGGRPATEEEQRAWDERRRAWEEDLEKNADWRMDERERRKDTSSDSWDGCL